MNSKSDITYKVEYPNATVENARGQISSYLNVGFDEFDILIDNKVLNNSSLLKDVNSTKSPLVLHFEEKRYLSEDELSRSIIIVELPMYEKMENELRKIFNQAEYGKIERIILEQSDEDYCDAVIVFDSILASERARLYPENILNKEVVIMKASSIPTTYLVEEEKEKDSRSVKLIYTGIKAANTVQEYDNKHYNIISKVGDTFGIIGDYGMKLANKADSTFDIANKAKPLFNTTPVKIFSTVVSHIGGMVLDPYLAAKAKFEREEKEMKMEEEKKKEENKIEEKDESIKLDETRDAKRVKINQEVKYETKKDLEEEKG